VVSISADDSKVKGNGTQINAEKAGLTQITTNPWFCLICENQRMRSIRFYLRTIKVFGSWKGKGNGTQIDAEKAGLPQAEKLRNWIRQKIRTTNLEFFERR
jgi:hypothetical protein